MSGIIWRSVAMNPPPRGVVLLTKIDDENGPRNEQLLRLGRRSNMWFYPDGSMYVYYTPTHWAWA